MEIIPYESCEHCDGEGYFTSTDFTFKKVNVACPHCCGLGWNMKDLDTKEDLVA